MMDKLVDLLIGWLINTLEFDIFIYRTNWMIDCLIDWLIKLLNCWADVTFSSLVPQINFTRSPIMFNTLRQRQNERHFPDYIFKWIFLNENVWISIKIPLKFVSRGPISNIPALVQIMAWRRPGDKPLSEPMMVSLLTHICVTLPQWVNPRRNILKQPSML